MFKKCIWVAICALFLGTSAYDALGEQSQPVESLLKSEAPPSVLFFQSFNLEFRDAATKQKLVGLEKLKEQDPAAYDAQLNAMLDQQKPEIDTQYDLTPGTTTQSEEVVGGRNVFATIKAHLYQTNPDGYPVSIRVYDDEGTLLQTDTLFSNKDYQIVVAAISKTKQENDPRAWLSAKRVRVE